MGKKPVTRAALLGALCLPIIPALAQDGRGPLLSFGVNQSFEVGDNLNLETPSAGSTVQADTQLSFGVLSETAIDLLSLDVSGSLQVEQTSQDGSNNGIKDPNLRFRYSRDVGNSAFDFRASYSQSDVNDLGSISDFLDENGSIVLPDNLGDLTGTGTQTVSSISARLDLGREAPIGFVLSAGIDTTNYSDVSSSSDLQDFERQNAVAQTRLRFSPITTGTLGLRYDTYNTNDPTGTDRVTTAADVGLETSLSARTDLEASLGVSEVESTEDGIKTTRTGLIGNIAATFAMPNGTASVNADATLDEDGNPRLDFVLGRSLDLTDGTFSASLGLTKPDGGNAALIGGLIWRRDLPSGAISARIDRNVSSSDQDVSLLTTLASLDYDHSINEVSGVGFSLLYAVQDGTDTSDKVTRTDLSAAYRHALTEDWNLNTGISYQVRDQANEGRAESPSIFISIGRRFEFRP